MNETLIGIVTFGNLKYTRLAVEESLRTSNQVDIYGIVGKPDDTETENYFKEKNIPYLRHKRNVGFPASINDIYDYFINNNYKYLIMQGNDVIPYPFAIDNLIYIAKHSAFDWIGAKEVSVKALVKDYPNTKQYFTGDNLVCNDFTAKPWEVFSGYSNIISIDKAGLADCQNLNLYTRNAIETLGYTDVNFYPNGYFNDNDYVKRAIELDVKSCTSVYSYYFHFWSRTLKEVRRENKHFGLNEKFYIEKWGGSPGKETYKIPFDGKTKNLYNETDAPNTLKIDKRNFEWSIIDYWSSK